MLHDTSDDWLQELAAHGCFLCRGEGRMPSGSSGWSECLNCLRVFAALQAVRDVEQDRAFTQWKKKKTEIADLRDQLTIEKELGEKNGMEVLALRTKLERLKAMLAKALDEWEYACEYKGDYFRKKHGDDVRIAEMRSVLLEEQVPPLREVE